MILTDKLGQTELQNYLAWTRVQTKQAEKEGLYQKAFYFNKQENWALWMLEHHNERLTVKLNHG